MGAESGEREAGLARVAPFFSAETENRFFFFYLPASVTSAPLATWNSTQ